ncbi:hypothetical protein NL676_037146 [Syzygium grande]|nr:hypothetical protein NL676_037146 [Syzygium grande]
MRTRTDLPSPKTQTKKRALVGPPPPPRRARWRARVGQGPDLSEADLAVAASRRGPRPLARPHPRHRDQGGGKVGLTDPALADHCAHHCREVPAMVA